MTYDVDLFRSWVGLPYSTLDCWSLVRTAYARANVDLDPDYFRALSRFRVVSDTGLAINGMRPWDVLAIRNHPIVVNHCGLYLGDNEFLHALEDSGATISRVDRDPWAQRIAGVLRLKEGT